MRSVTMQTRELNYKEYSPFMRRWLDINVDVIGESYPSEEFIMKRSNNIIKRIQRGTSTVRKASYRDSMGIIEKKTEEEIYKYGRT